MVQSFLDLFNVLLQSYNNKIILLSLGIFASTAVVYLVKDLIHL